MTNTLVLPIYRKIKHLLEQNNSVKRLSALKTVVKGNATFDMRFFFIKKKNINRKLLINRKQMCFLIFDENAIPCRFI